MYSQSGSLTFGGTGTKNITGVNTLSCSNVQASIGVQASSVQTAGVANDESLILRARQLNGTVTGSVFCHVDGVSIFTSNGPTGVSASNTLYYTQSGNLAFQGTGTKNITGVNSLSCSSVQFSDSTLQTSAFKAHNLVVQAIDSDAGYKYPVVNNATTMGKTYIITNSSGVSPIKTNNQIDFQSAVAPITGWYCYVKNMEVTVPIDCFQNGGAITTGVTQIYGRSVAGANATTVLVYYDGTNFNIY